MARKNFKSRLDFLVRPITPTPAIGGIQQEKIEKTDDKKIQSYQISHQKVLKQEGDEFNNLEFAFDKHLIIYSKLNRIGFFNLDEHDVEDKNRYRIRVKDGCALMKVISAYHLIYTNKERLSMTLLDFNTNTKLRKYDVKSKINTISLYGNGNVPFFLTSDNDGDVSLWDYRYKEKYGARHFDSPPLAAYHPEGGFMAVGLESSILQIFDISRDSRNCIYQFKIEPEKDVEWKQVKYSKNGEYILVSTNADVVYLYDGASAVLLKVFSGIANSNREEIAAEFSQCGKFLICGSSDAKIHVFNISSGDHVCVYRNKSESSPRLIAMSKTADMFATAGNRVLHVWQPTYEI